jgi:hypothetical protein
MLEKRWKTDRPSDRRSDLDELIKQQDEIQKAKEWQQKEKAPEWNRDRDR